MEATVGVYQLCEQIRIAENRVGVYNWKNICDEAAEEIAQSLKIEEKEKALYRKGFEKVVEQELLADFFLDGHRRIHFQRAGGLERAVWYLLSDGIQAGGLYRLFGTGRIPRAVSC